MDERQNFLIQLQRREDCQTGPQRGQRPGTGEEQVGASGAVYCDRQVGVARFCGLPVDWIICVISGGGEEGLPPVWYLSPG